MASDASPAVAVERAGVAVALQIEGVSLHLFRTGVGLVVVNLYVEESARQKRFSMSRIVRALLEPAQSRGQARADLLVLRARL